VTHVEVVLSGIVYKFPHEPAAIHFLFGLKKWEQNDEVRLVTGEKVLVKWTIGDFIK